MKAEGRQALSALPLSGDSGPARRKPVRPGRAEVGRSECPRRSATVRQASAGSTGFTHDRAQSRMVGPDERVEEPAQETALVLGAGNHGRVDSGLLARERNDLVVEVAKAEPLCDEAANLFAACPGRP